MADLTNAIKNLWENDFVQKNPTKPYKLLYPNEYPLVAAYIAGGDRPDPTNFSRLGKGLVEAEDVRRGPQQPPPPTGSRYFADSSPWYALQGSNPSIDPKSAMYIAAIKGDVAAIGVGIDTYTAAVYTADDSTPRRRWHTNDGNWWMENVPTPNWNWKTTANATEWYTSIIDKQAGAIYDVYWSGFNGNPGYPGSTGTIRPDGGMNYYTGAVYKIGGSGFWKGAPWASPSGQGCYLGGLVGRDEFVAGKVEHALILGLHNAIVRGPSWQGVAGSFVHPSTQSDGKTTRADALPMGSRICIKPDVDVDAMSFLNPGQKILAHAIQKYGMYVGICTGGAAKLSCQSWREGDGAGTNPYGGSFDTSAQAANFFKIFDYCHVLTPPASVAYDSKDMWTPANPHT